MAPHVRPRQHGYRIGPHVARQNDTAGWISEGNESPSRGSPAGGGAGGPRSIDEIMMNMAPWRSRALRIRRLCAHGSESVSHAIIWTGAAKWATQLVTWASTILVARLLAPEDFGLVGMAQIFLMLVSIFTEFGLGTAIIAHPELSERQFGQLNAVSVAVSTIAVLLTCAAAIALGWFFAAPQLPLLVVATSTVFAINGFRIVPSARLQLEFKFRYLAILESISALLVGGAMVGFAALGFQYWTLVIGSVLGSSVITLGAVAARPCRLIRPRAGEISKILSVSSDLLLSRFTWWVQVNADALIVGRVLGKAPLGAYAMTMTIASLPVDKVTALVTQVSPPFVAAVKAERRALGHLVLVLTGMLSLLVFPMAVGIALVADDFVRFALGPKWLAVIPALRFLSILAAFRSVQTLLSPVIVVTGGTRLFMYLGLIEAAVMSMAFWVGSHFGITGVALSWLLVHPLMRAPTYWWVFRQTGITVMRYLSALWPSLRAPTLMAMGVVGIKLLMPSVWSSPAKLTIQIGLGAIVYLAISFLQRRRLWGMYEEFRELGRPRVFPANNGQSPSGPMANSYVSPGSVQVLDRRGSGGGPVGMNQSTITPVLGLRVGERVEVRSIDEILATLDDRAALDGLPFMPEMVKFCGRPF